MRFNAFHRAVSAVVDWIFRERPDLDAQKVGLFGNSLGGYLAMDAGRRDPRIKAVISNGGFADARSMHSWPPQVIAAFTSCLGLELAEAQVHIQEHLDLARVPVQNRPPTLVVHGGREDLSDEDEAQDAAKIMDGTLLVVEYGWHTCTNRDHLVSPVFADWMSSALEGESPTGFAEARITDERGYERFFAG